MNKHIFLSIVMLTVLSSSLCANNEVTISGTIIGDINEAVEYTSSEKGGCFWGFPKPVLTDSLGNFTVSLNIDKPTFFQILIGTYSYGVLVIEPGEKYKIQIDLNFKEKSSKPICKNELGQRLYNKLFKKNVNRVVKSYKNYENISDIRKEIELSKTSEIKEFRKLLINKDISESFFNLVTIDRECFYSVVQGKVAQLKYFAILRNNSNSSDDVKIMWAETFQNMPISTTYLLSSFWHYKLVENFISFKMLTSDSFDKEELMSIQKQGLMHTHTINTAKNYLEGNELEYYQARYLYESAMQMKFEEELITLFENFKEEFPESQFSNILHSMIKPISDYLDNTKHNNGKIKFIPNYENLNSLKECLIPFKGKRVYVDVWATWCLACRAQFKHKDNLKKVLDAEGIEMIYLSIDSGGKYDKKWKELIKYYNLEGNHLRANSELYSDLKMIFDANGSITIPWYLIIDEQGDILTKHAKSPSQMKRLEMQLKKQ